MCPHRPPRLLIQSVPATHSPPPWQSACSKALRSNISTPGATASPRLFARNPAERRTSQLIFYHERVPFTLCIRTKVDHVRGEPDNFVTHLECSLNGDHYEAGKIHNLS